MLVRSLLKLPTVGFYESTLNSHRFSRGSVAWIRRIIFRRFNSVVTVGVASTNAVLDMGIPRSRIFESFNAVDVHEFYEFAREARRKLTHSNTHEVIFIGQLIKRKNLATALVAWDLVRNKNDVFRIVGDGPERLELEKIISARNMSQYVTFHGYLEGPELLSVLSKSKTLVLPSTQEVWGLVVNEALAAGLHVVVSKKCGVAESIGDMLGVYLCSPEEASISEALLQSRAEWKGYIVKPKILEHTPQNLAHSIYEAIMNSKNQREVIR